MDEPTLIALKDSIAKWEANAEITAQMDARLNIGSCALCHRFHSAWRGSLNPLARDRCKGCPVFEATGKKTCGGTPYEHALDAFERGDLAGFKRHAVTEANFLKSLLPPEA